MLTITNDTPIRTVASCVVFQATDAAGPFELWVDSTALETLVLEAPSPVGEVDWHRHAVSLIETAVRERKPVTASSGLRVLML